MKNLKTIIIFLFTYLGYSQDFEGKIEYQITYFDKNNVEVNIPKVNQLMGEKSTFITKKGKYKQITNSDFMSFQLYSSNEKKLYIKNNWNQKESDTLFYLDPSKLENVSFKYEITKNAATILGYLCDKLTVKDTLNIIREEYFYSPDLKLNPKYFKDFSAFNKNKITDLMKAVFLKLSYYYPEFTLSMTAIDIKKIKISDSEFNLPPRKAFIEYQ